MRLSTLLLVVAALHGGSRPALAEERSNGPNHNCASPPTQGQSCWSLRRRRRRGRAIWESKPMIAGPAMACRSRRSDGRQSG